MHRLCQTFAPAWAILTPILICSAFWGGDVQAQTGGTGNTNTGGTGTGTGAAGLDSPLGFDAGVTLERTERATRDTGSFVGSQAPTVGNFGATNQAAGGLGGRGGANQQQGQFLNFFNQLNRGAQANNQRSQIRVPLRLGFAKPPSAVNNPVVAQRVSSTLASRFDALQRFANPIDVKLEGTTAILSGTVADEETSRIASRLALLEPGVYKVQNELAVSPALQGPELLPTPAER